LSGEKTDEKSGEKKKTDKKAGETERKKKEIEE